MNMMMEAPLAPVQTPDDATEPRLVRISRGANGIAAEVLTPAGESIEIMVRGAATPAEHLRAIQAAFAIYRGGATLTPVDLRTVGKALHTARSAASASSDGPAVAALEIASRVIGSRVEICPRCERARDHDLPSVPTCACGVLS